MTDTSTERPLLPQRRRGAAESAEKRTRCVGLFSAASALLCDLCGKRGVGLLLLLFLLVPATATPALARRVQGVVGDVSGRPIPGAVVSVSAGRHVGWTSTDEHGRFRLEWAGPDAVSLTIEAKGFSPHRSRARVDEERPIVVVLRAGGFREEVTVTASRAADGAGSTPASVSVLTSIDLGTSAGLTLDDTLRRVPGFTLFRRTGSRAANPTAQGASLRGVGASGASRAVVLEDGVPLNDPFGGWVYWGRVPRAAVDRVEVVRGGGSELYGSGALAGVIQILRPASDRPRLDTELAVATQETANGSLFAAARRGGWGLRLGADVFTTSGYFAVPAEERGEVDSLVAAHHHLADLTLERSFGEARAFVRGGAFRESRGNGTPLQENSTYIDQVIAGFDGPVLGGRLRARADRSWQDYYQSFSAVAADRRTERLTVEQHVPSRGEGLLVQWTRGLGARHALVIGAERRGVRGTSEETQPGAAVPNTAGGSQRSTAVFVEDAWQPASWLSLGGALRLDRWRNVDGRDGPAAAPRSLPDRSESAFSPRAGLRVRPFSWLALSGSAYRAFRAPTLNELYRSFRVGNVLTRASADLRAERLDGAEAGLTLLPARRVALRGTAFSLDVERTVANVTLTTTPSLITRERRNLGAVRSRGAEMDLEVQLGQRTTLSAAWMWVESTVTDAPQDPLLVGRRVPQVPRNQGSLRLSSGLLGFTWAVEGRYAGLQYDDDRNTLSLRAFWTLDAFLSRSINPWMEAYVAVENIRDVAYDVGRTPTRTVGPPRQARAGLRVRLRGATAPLS